MPIEVVCTSCEKKLRVPDRAAGKRIKCPKCQGAINVPDPAAGVGGTLPDSWFVKTEDGEDYGPVTKTELDDWHKEGRLTADCQVLRDGAEQWQWATDLYPDLDQPVADPAMAGAAAGVAPGQPAPGQGGPFDFAEGQQQPLQAGAMAPQGGAPQQAAGGYAPDGTELSDKKKMVAGLLGIFLGAYGVHRFYLGYTGLGIAQLAVTFLTCGVGAWWGLIEGFLIISGSIDKDAQGRKLID